MSRLIRYGLKWKGPQEFIPSEMEDGYWTPWHFAEATIDDLTHKLSKAQEDYESAMHRIGQLEAMLAGARMGNEIWEKTMMEVIGEDGPASVADAVRKLQDQASQAPGLPPKDEWRKRVSKWVDFLDGLKNAPMPKSQRNTANSIKKEIERYLEYGVGYQEAPASGEVEPVAWDDPAVDPIVSKLYRKFKEWSQRGFTADDVTWCEVRGYVAELMNTHPPAKVPEGYALIPESMCLSYEDIESIITMTGWDQGRDDFGEGVLWVGTLKDNDGNETYGLHISCIEVMEEGALPVQEFPKPVLTATTPETHKGCGGRIIGRMRDGDCVTCEKCGKAGSVLVDDGGTDIEWFAGPTAQEGE